MAVPHRKVHRLCREFVAAVAVKPLDNIEMTVSRSHVHDKSGAAVQGVGIQPLDELQVSTSSCMVEGFRRTALTSMLMEPLYDFQMAVTCSAVHCSNSADFIAPHVKPLDDREVSIASRSVYRVRPGARKARLKQPLDSGQVPHCCWDIDRRQLTDEEHAVLQPLELLDSRVFKELVGLHHSSATVVVEVLGNITKAIEDSCAKRVAALLESHHVLGRSYRNLGFVDPCGDVQVALGRGEGNQSAPVWIAHAAVTCEPLQHVQMSLLHCHLHETTIPRDLFMVGSELLHDV